MAAITSYPLAVFLCFISMICWGSWANTRKLSPQARPLRFFYWDYTAGVFLFMTLAALTAGSHGNTGQPFLANLAQADASALASAFTGGVVQNVSNILIVYAIDIAGIAVAFPMGVGIGMVIGVVQNYVATPVGDPRLLFGGVGLVIMGIVVNALAYSRRGCAGAKTSRRGIVLSIVCGILGGFYYRFVAAAISPDFSVPVAGQLTPYTALWVFSLGVTVSTILCLPLLKWEPARAAPAGKEKYFGNGIGTHSIGLAGGITLGIGTLLNFIASGPAGFPISFSLGQGAAMVGAFWGVFVWKEFRGCSRGTAALIALMFVAFIAGLAIIAAARVV